MVTAVAVLGVAATALASGFNTYTAKVSFAPSKAGSAHKPSPIGMRQILTANGTAGNRAAPLVDLRSTVYGMVSDGKDFPTCSLNTIATAKNDTGCPKGAEVATGNVHALLGPASNPSATATGSNGKSAITACNPGLDVWNAGQGHLVFFFTSTTAIGSAHYCGGVKTGSTPPYTGTIKQSGKNMVLDVPLPPSVSTMVLGSPTWGSLIKEDITWKKLTKKVHGKTKAFFASVGCKNGKRPWKQLFTATFAPKTESFTTGGSAKCS